MASKQLYNGFTTTDTTLSGIADSSIIPMEIWPRYGEFKYTAVALLFLFMFCEILRVF